MKDVWLLHEYNPYNTARAVSISPDGIVRFTNLKRQVTRSTDKVISAKEISSLVCDVLEQSHTHQVSIRSFTPEQPSGNPFFYGVSADNDPIGKICDLLDKGYHVLINETIDTDDGGVSCVYYDGYVEFAPKRTPRLVEEVAPDEYCRLPLQQFLTVIETVYDVTIPKELFKCVRLEFSVHPVGTGRLHEKYVVWERAVEGEPPHSTGASKPYWPNPFSSLIGDKAFGLLMAHSYGFKVPMTEISFRRTDLYKSRPFGTKSTRNDTGWKWLRTCPATFTPGKYGSIQSMISPWDYMDQEDASGEAIMSCLVQDAVGGKHGAQFSGNVLTDKDGRAIIEVVPGNGDLYMLGITEPRICPPDLRWLLTELHHDLCVEFGPVSFEYAYDGKEVWIVQLHLGRTETSSRESQIVVHPVSDPEQMDGRGWACYYPDMGLDHLRALVTYAETDRTGIFLVDVGVGSHAADICRHHKVPAIIISDPGPTDDHTRHSLIVYQKSK